MLLVTTPRFESRSTGWTRPVAGLQMRATAPTVSRCVKENPSLIFNGEMLENEIHRIAIEEGNDVGGHKEERRTRWLLSPSLTHAKIVDRLDTVGKFLTFCWPSRFHEAGESSQLAIIHVDIQ